MLEHDQDLRGMSYVDLFNEVLKLRAGIRQHRDAKGHDLCWWVPELWGLLPEAVTLHSEVPSTDEFLQRCITYRKTLPTCG